MSNGVSVIAFQISHRLRVDFIFPGRYQRHWVKKRFPFFLVPALHLMLLLFCLSGCAVPSDPLMPYSTNDPFYESSALISRIKAINSAIETCKGTGWITLKNETQSNRFRLAWATKGPDKLRVSLLSAGHPIETIIADGHRVRFISHTGRHPVHTINKANPSLEKALTIPVSVQDIITIFSGKIPIRSFDRAQQMEITYGTEMMPGSETRQIVTDRMVLLKQNNKNVEKIVLTPGGTVVSYALYDSQDFGKSAGSEVTVLHRRLKRFDSFLIPIEINFSDREGRSVAVEISKYFPNIPVKESTFDLTASG